METINKLGANMQCISSAEKLYTQIELNKSSSASAKDGVQEGLVTHTLGRKPHIDLAAG